MRVLASGGFVGPTGTFIALYINGATVSLTTDKDHFWSANGAEEAVQPGITSITAPGDRPMTSNIDMTLQQAGDQWIVAGMVARDTGEGFQFGPAVLHGRVSIF